MSAERWNCPPCQRDCSKISHIVHFHGPKLWDKAAFPDLRINSFDFMREIWMKYLDADELEQFASF
jgi:hypothetical protein